MQKFLVLISLSVLVAIYVGCNRIQEIVTPKQEQTLKIGFVVAGNASPIQTVQRWLSQKLTSAGASLECRSN